MQCISWHQASTLEISENWHQTCLNRLANNDNDNWAHEAMDRIKNCKDFVAAEFMYQVKFLSAMYPFNMAVALM